MSAIDEELETDHSRGENAATTATGGCGCVLRSWMKEEESLTLTPHQDGMSLVFTTVDDATGKEVKFSTMLPLIALRRLHDYLYSEYRKKGNILKLQGATPVPLRCLPEKELVFSCGPYRNGYYAVIGLDATQESRLDRFLERFFSAAEKEQRGPQPSFGL